MKLTNKNKTEIANAMTKWLAVESPERSGNKLSEKASISTAYISHLKNGKLEIPSDEVFRKIADAIGFSIVNDDNAELVELHWLTENFNKIQTVGGSARLKRKIVTMDSDESGLGKTHGLEYLSNNEPQTIYIKCTNTMGVKELLSLIMAALHIKEEGIKGNYNKLLAIRTKVTSAPGWLLIIDETEKVITRSSMLKVIWDIVDFCYGRCGLIVSGLNIIEEIERRAKKGRAGYKQTKRRLFTNIVKIHAISKKDMVYILKESGITNTDSVNWFIKNVSDYQMLSEYLKDLPAVASKINREDNTEKSIDEIFTPQFLHALFNEL